MGGIRMVKKYSLKNSMPIFSSLYCDGVYSLKRKREIFEKFLQNRKFYEENEYYVRER